MYTRLAFAVAAHLEPEILLVDEVLAVGDSKFQKKCLGKMENVAGEGRTVLFVSHNLGAIQGLCHKAMVLEKGGLQFDGETTRAIQHYIENDVQVSEAKIKLKNHTERSPEFEAVLEKVELLVNERPSTTVGMGEKFEVSISFNSLEAVRGIGLSFEDMFGRRLFLASTNYTNPDLLGDSTRCARLVCRIPEIPFVPGNYYLTIIVAGFTKMLDKVERAASFDVVERDVFKTGIFPGKWKGLFYTRSAWRMEAYE
jgi:lipopolysaccharide transport system ATP-binding protein